METFGKMLKQARVTKRFTLKELSKYTGKAISYLSDIEHNRKRPPDIETVKKIESFLDIKDEILSDLALKLRKKLPKNFQRKIMTKPKLAEALLRGEDLTDEEFDELINSCEKIIERRKK
jgi:transcriptional regulator with XRE-family HTH domain